MQADTWLCEKGNECRVHSPYIRSSETADNTELRQLTLTVDNKKLGRERLSRGQKY